MPLKAATGLENPYFKNACILQNIQLPHISSPFLQCFLLEAIYPAHYKPIHQPKPSETIVEEQLETERLNNG